MLSTKSISVHALPLLEDSLVISSHLFADSLLNVYSLDPDEDKLPPLSAMDKKMMSQLMDVKLTYDQQLNQLAQGAMAFDRRTHFNPYHFINWNKEGLKNNYVYKYIAFKRPEPLVFKINDSLLSFQHQRFTVEEERRALDPFKDQAWDAFVKSRNNVFTHQPSMVVCHWNHLPDPPAMVDTVFLPLIDDVDLGFELENSYVGKDHKIEAFKKENSPWTFNGLSSLHTTETLVSNWTKGGQNSVSVLSVTNFNADYQMKNLKWENDFEVRLGALFYSEDKDDETSSKIQKNADAFKINSKVGYKAIKTWYYSASLNINSQFFEGVDKKGNIISGFLSPASIYLSAGMDYKYQKLLSVFISPMTYKNTLVVDNDSVIRKKYGLSVGERSKKELGGYIRATLKLPVNQDLTWNSKLYLFSNYRESPENVDVDFENVFDYKFSTVFSLRFFLHLKYDDDTSFDWIDKNGNERNGPRLQFKQQMSIGLFYRF